MIADQMETGRYFLIGDESITVEQRVIRAAESYHKKTGKLPNRAHVNPKICNIPFSMSFKDQNIDVYPDPIVLHYITWIGIGGNNGKEI